MLIAAAVRPPSLECASSIKMELRGLEPLTFSLRRLHRRRTALGAGESRCILCILIMVMMSRGTQGAHAASIAEPLEGGVPAAVKVTVDSR